MTGLWLTRRRPAAGQPRPGPLLALLAGVLLILTVLLAAVGVLGGGRHVDAGTLPPTHIPPLPVPAPAGPLAPPHPARPPAQTAGPPRRLQLPALGIDAPVTPVTVSSAGVLGVPDDVRTVGWWDHSAPTGAPAGSTVIDGHVDSAAAGPGALFRLADTPLGAAVTLSSAGHLTRYTVQARRSYPKTALPGDLFVQTGQPRLVIVTCGGTFDTTAGHYSNNIVIYATPS